MNLFQLISKQMRQRALSTVLTTLSITLGVALAIAILVLQREGQNLFGQNDYGYEVLAGIKASGLQLVVNGVYHIDRSPGNIKYSVYEDLFKRELPFRADVKTAIPQSVGDTYQGQPIVATTALIAGSAKATTRANGSRTTPNRRCRVASSTGRTRASRSPTASRWTTASSRPSSAATARS